MSELPRPLLRMALATALLLTQPVHDSEARVTSGDSDWVLSRIEQDESYQG